MSHTKRVIQLEKYGGLFTVTVHAIFCVKYCISDRLVNWALQGGRHYQLPRSVVVRFTSSRPTTQNTFCILRIAVYITVLKLNISPKAGTTQQKFAGKNIAKDAVCRWWKFCNKNVMTKLSMVYLRTISMWLIQSLNHFFHRHDLTFIFNHFWATSSII